MKNIPITSMIAYLQRTVDEWTKCLADGEGEEWMTDAIGIETAIINVLKAVKYTEGLPLPAPVTSFNEDAIGNNVKVKVKLLHEIEILKERIQGSQNPDGNYATLLREKEDALKWTNQTLRDLKNQHKLQLQHRLATLDREIEASFNAFDIDEMNSVRKGLVKKIEMIDAEIKTL
jgi:hypothetical protein